MNFAKRMLAVGLAVVLVFTFAACSGSKASGEVAATCGDRSVSGGLYMRFLLDAYTLADTYKDDPDAEVLDTTVEGIPAAEWMVQTARDDVARYFACMDQFEETDMEYTDADQAAVDSYAASMLESYPYLFESNGVNLQAMKEYYEYNVKSMALFDHYYAEGGEKEVPAEEIKQAMRDSYNLTKVMIFDKALITVDADGNVIQPTEEEKAEAEAKARGYYDRAVAGEDFEQLIIEWETDLFGENGIDHTHEEAGSHDLVTRIGNPDVPEAYSSVMDTAPYGVPQFIEDADVYYVAMRYDIAENEYSYESYRATVLLTLRSEDYRAMSDEWIAAKNIRYNEDVLKQYTPQSIYENMTGAGATNALTQP